MCTENKYALLKYTVYRPLDSAAGDGRTSHSPTPQPPPPNNYDPGTVTIIPSGPVATQWAKYEKHALKNTAVRTFNDPAETSLLSSVGQDIATFHGISRLIAVFT